MAEWFARNDSRFRKLADSDLKEPGINPWLGIEFTEMGGLPVKKLYVTNGTETFEIIKAPPVGGGPWLYQILYEITPQTHPFLHRLIHDEFTEA